MTHRLHHGRQAAARHDRAPGGLVDPARETWTRRRLLGASAALLLPAWGRAATDRLVVTDGALAHIVVALGGAGLLAAVGGDADHLAELAAVPRLPPFPEPSADPLLAFDPSQVLLGAAWAKPRTLDELHQAGVRVHVVDDDATEACVVRRIRMVASALGRPADGDALVLRFQDDLRDAARQVARVPRRPRALFVRADGRQGLRVAGQRTDLSALLGLLGTDNVAGAFEGYAPMDRQAMIGAAPEVILTHPAGMVVRDGVPLALHVPGALDTPAGRSHRLIVVHGPDLQGIGLHTPQGIRTLGRQIHPAIFP